MIKITIDGIILECNTAQEAAEVARLMRANNTNINNAIPAAVINNKYTANEAEGSVHHFIHKIKQLKSSKINSIDLANVLEVKGAKALGPKLRGMARQINKIYHIDLNGILKREVRAGMDTLWHIDGDALNKIKVHPQ